MFLTIPFSTLFFVYFLVAIAIAIVNDRFFLIVSNCGHNNQTTKVDQLHYFRQEAKGLGLFPASPMELTSTNWSALLGACLNMYTRARSIDGCEPSAIATPSLCFHNNLYKAGDKSYTIMLVRGRFYCRVALGIVTDPFCKLISPSLSYFHHVEDKPSF